MRVTTIRALTAVVLLAMGAGLGCRTGAPVRKSRAVAPPWIDNKGSQVHIVVPAGESMNGNGGLPTYDTLVIRKDASFDAPDLETVTGRIEVEEGATLVAISLRSCEVLVLDEGASVVAPQLRHAGVVVIGDDATLTAPWLRRCGGVRLNESSVLDAPCTDPTRGRAIRSPSSAPAPPWIANGPGVQPVAEEIEDTSAHPVSVSEHHTTPKVDEPTEDKHAMLLVSLVSKLKRLERAGRAMNPLRTGKTEMDKLRKCGDLMRDYQGKSKALGAEADRLPMPYKIHLSPAATELGFCVSCRPNAQEACDRARGYIAAGEEAIREAR